MSNKWYFKSRMEGTERKLDDGVITRLFSGKNVMLSWAEIEPHAITTVHSHPEEQWGILLEGDCVRVQGDEEIAMQPGDFWCTPGNMPHGVRTGASGAKILDIFSPPRGSYQQPGEGLGAKIHARKDK